MSDASLTDNAIQQYTKQHYQTPLMLHCQASIAAQWLQQCSHSIQILPIVTMTLLYLAPSSNSYPFPSVYISKHIVQYIEFSNNLLLRTHFKHLAILYPIKMDKKRRKDLAAAHVASIFQKFNAKHFWVPTVPDPKPVGWIDLSDVPSHPDHAFAVKQMIFDSHHPELFDYKPQKVTFELIQIPEPRQTHLQRGENVAQMILPSAGELFVQTKWVVTDYSIHDRDSDRYSHACLSKTSAGRAGR